MWKYARDCTFERKCHSGSQSLLQKRRNFSIFRLQKTPNFGAVTTLWLHFLHSKFLFEGAKHCRDCTFSWNLLFRFRVLACGGQGQTGADARKEQSQRACRCGRRASGRCCRRLQWSSASSVLAFWWSVVSTGREERERGTGRVDERDAVVFLSKKKDRERYIEKEN